MWNPVSSAKKYLKRAARNVGSGAADVFQASTYGNLASDAERAAQQYVNNPEMAALAVATGGGSILAHELLGGASRALGQSGALGILGRGSDPYAYAIEGSQRASAEIGLGNQAPPPTGAEPPGYDYANDPNYQQQFTRLRKAARMLGRAGTYRNRGASSLGTDSPLGTPMQLTGA